MLEVSLESVIPALVGGWLIGLSAVALLFLNGRVAGVSGILNSLVFDRKDRQLWRLLFILGLVLGGFFFSATRVVPPEYPASAWLLILGGFLVGFGARIGGGCTSGHGICGLSLLSLRSLVAVIVFMLTGILTVYVLHHIVRVDT